MEPIAVLYEDRDDEARLMATAPHDHPGHVVLDVVGPGGAELVMTAGDARRLMYQLSCASIEAMALARESATAAAPYAHA